MSFIPPCGTFRCLTDIKFTMSYQHVVRFTSISAQTAYFEGKIKHIRDVNGELKPMEWVNITYTRRPDTKAVRVEGHITNFVDINYCMYQNSDQPNSQYGDRWWYAFVVKCEYINNNTVELTLVEDIWQNYHLYMDLPTQQYVLRQHSVQDKPSEHLIDEGVPFGEYQYELIGAVKQLMSLSVVVNATQFKNTPEAPGFYSGVFTGSGYRRFPVGEYEALCAYFEYLTSNNLSDGIISVFMVPNSFDYTPTTDGSIKTNKIDIKIENNWGKPITENYTPVNNKLYMFPYNFLYITDYSGNTWNCRYEDFDVIVPGFGSYRTQPEFIVYTCFSPNPEALLVPYRYKGQEGAQLNERMLLTGWPQCSWQTDTYKAYLAATSARREAFVTNYSERINFDHVTSGIDLVSSIGSAAVQLATGAALGGPVGLAMAAPGAVGTLYNSGKNMVEMDIEHRKTWRNYQAEMRDKESLPAHAHGTISNAMGVASQTKNFGFYRCHIQEGYCYVLDSFFTLYGYLHNNITDINLDSRPHFNYIQIDNPVIYGGIPADSLVKLKNIFADGVWLWKNGDEVGDFTLDNRPNPEDRWTRPADWDDWDNNQLGTPDEWSYNPPQSLESEVENDAQIND